MVSSEFTLTHILLTSLLTTLLPTLVISTMLLVIRVPPLMMQVCSTVHMYLCRWYVLLERTPSSLRLASRPDMVWLLTPSLKEPLRVLVDSRLTATDTIEESWSRTSCDSSPYLGLQAPLRGAFFHIRINSQKHYGYKIRSKNKTGN